MKNMQPVLFCALPRSRTAWLAAYFGTYHDLSTKTSVDDMLVKIGERGNSDSGMIFHYQRIADNYPAAKWVFVDRNPQDCLQSLTELKFYGDLTEPWKLVEKKVAEFKMAVSSYVIDFNHLDYATAMRDLHEFLELPFCYDKFRIFKDLKVTTKILWPQQ